jgi:hypothetical protein
LIVRPTRAEASSTLRLKSFMVLLAILWREWTHATLRNCQAQPHYFAA